MDGSLLEDALIRDVDGTLAETGGCTTQEA